MKKLKVDESLCMGCGACVDIDSSDFEFNAKGISQAKNEQVSDDNIKVVDAVESCPTGAISLEECAEN